MDTLDYLLENNARWAEEMKTKDAEYFSRIYDVQTPKYLWIGCSDSRISANMTMGLKPGELFVHRNIANVVVHTDMNCLSVIQFAVEALGVEHIIVCGHYNCGGVKAAMENVRFGLIDNWLRHIQDVMRTHEATLEAIEDELNRFYKLCELNVLEQTLNVCETTFVRDAWQKGQNLTVHGWIYDMREGYLKKLGIHLGNREQLESFRRRVIYK
ncbi:MAG: carbonate dehydratase [Acidobacteria bacterium]|jgi:carbonic anhydrase|nr:carbonate dehydratase [Acidobacteriota bacterium]